MPTRSQSWFTAGLRFCGSCLGTLACWAVWLVLGATLAGLIYISVAKELPVPGFVLRRVETELARANLVIRFGQARFDPTGKILLENVSLRLKQFEEPLITSRLVYLRRSFWSVLAGQPVPDEIRLEGAVLQLPAMLSPSGTVEPLIRDLAVTLQHNNHFWQVGQFTCRGGRLTVTARGELTVPARPAGAPPLTFEEITARFLQASRRMALGIHQLDASTARLASATPPACFSRRNPPASPGTSRSRSGRSPPPPQCGSTGPAPAPCGCTSRPGAPPTAANLARRKACAPCSPRRSSREIIPSGCPRP